jgi:parvulin-like peptidyl-prolyl isomerase
VILMTSTNTRRRTAFTIAATVGFLWAGAPWHNASAAGEVVAQGGSIQLGASDVQALVASLPDAQRQSATASVGSLEQVVRADIIQRSVLADAQAQNFGHDPATAKTLKQLDDMALTRLWIAHEAAVPAGYPSESDVQAAYDLLKQRAPYEYHLAQIFVSAPDGADADKLDAALSKTAAVRKQLASEDFAQVARQLSDDPSAAKGGDLGFLPATQLLPAVLTAVQSLTPGETVGPIKTADGLHFLKLIERKQTPLPALAVVHDRLVTALRARKQAQLEQSYLRGLDAKLDITVDQIELAKLQQSLK